MMSDVNKQLLERWAAFGKAMQKSGSELPRHLIADTEQAIAAAEQAQQSKTVTLEQLVANLKAGENGDAISAAMDQACADMELGRRMREQAQQAEPIAWEVRNGVVTHDFYKTAEDAEEVARDMQKSHDLSGSIAAFNVRPVYAQPPAVAEPGVKQNIGTLPVKDRYFLCRCEKCGWLGSSEECRESINYMYGDGDYYCPACGANGPDEMYEAEATFNAMLAAAQKATP